VQQDHDAPQDALDHTGRALDRAVRELERHVARGGWDGPVRVFALIRTAEAIARDPSLRDQLPPDLVQSADEDAEHVTSVEQEGLPEAASIEELLGRIAWPDSVDGAAVVLERIVVPPDAEQGLPEDPDAALQQLLDHPAREDVRMAAGVLRSGHSACALRTRRHDDDAAVASGTDLVPALVAALRVTLQD
jgi:hypothetical protein